MIRLGFIYLHQEIQNDDTKRQDAQNHPETRWIDWQFKPVKDIEFTSRCICQRADHGAECRWQLADDTRKDNQGDAITDSLAR
jgi:hypothetical protein